jgi:hypothetical protein
MYIFGKAFIKWPNNEFNCTYLLHCKNIRFDYELNTPIFTTNIYQDTVYYFIYKSFALYTSGFNFVSK